MRSYIIVITMYFTLLPLACQDTGEDLRNTPSDIVFYKSIGKQIPFETGMRWMEFYKKQNSHHEGRADNQGRTDIAAYTYAIPASQVEVMLQSVSGLTGVAFHYGIDELGTTHIMAIPVDESLRLWSSIPGRIFVDGNTGNEITQSVARAWAQNYQHANPVGVWFHFFGQNIFSEIIAIPYFNTLDIEPAINDLDLTPQLLLIIWNENAIANGRTTAEECVVYDASSPCPPCAVE